MQCRVSKILAFAASACGGLIAVAESLTVIPGLPNGSMSMVVWDMTPDGSTVVGTADSHAVKWVGGPSSVDLGPGEAFGVSGDGTVVVGTRSFSAVRWDEQGEFFLPEPPNFSGYSQAVDASWGGTKIVGYVTSSSGLKQSCMWTDSTPALLGSLLPNGHSYSVAISLDGNIVSGFTNSPDAGYGMTAWEAYRWENGVMTGLGDLPGGDFLSKTTDMSPDGNVIAGYSHSGSGTEAFRWKDDQMIALGDLPGGQFYSIAKAVSGDGNVVGGYGRTNDGQAAFLWTPGSGMQLAEDVLVSVGIDLMGWQLTSVDAISEDGTRIAGRGFAPSDDSGSWVATIPEPSAITLMMGCVLLFVRLSRRRSWL